MLCVGYLSATGKAPQAFHGGRDFQRDNEEADRRAPCRAMVGSDKAAFSLPPGKSVSSMDGMVSFIEGKDNINGRKPK